MNYLITKTFFLSILLFFVSAGCITQLKVSNSISDSYQNYLALEESGIFYKNYEVSDWYEDRYLSGYQGKAVLNTSEEVPEVKEESEGSVSEKAISKDDDEFLGLKDPRLHYNHRHYIWGEGFSAYFTFQRGRNDPFFHKRGLSDAGHWYFSPTGHWFYFWYPYYSFFMNSSSYDSYWGTNDYFYNSYTRAQRYKENAVRYRTRGGYSTAYKSQNHRLRANSSAIERSSARTRNSSSDNGRVRNTGRSSAEDGSTGRSRGSSEGGDSRSRGGNK